MAGQYSSGNQATRGRKEKLQNFSQNQKNFRKPATEHVRKNRNPFSRKQPVWDMKLKKQGKALVDEKSRTLLKLKSPTSTRELKSFPRARSKMASFIPGISDGIYRRKY